MSVEWYDVQDMIADDKYSRALPAMHDAAEREIDTLITDKTPEWFESLGPDAWNEEIVDALWKACYHRDAFGVGQIILSRMELYLFDKVWQEIRDDWENYVDG